MNIEIRKAKVGDEIGVAKLFNEGLKRKNFIYIGRNTFVTKSRIAKWRKAYSEKKPEGYFFVAIGDGKLIGHVNFDFKRKGRGRHIADFGWIMHPDYQGKGIATNLLKFALDFAEKKGFKKAEAEISVPNTASLKLAKKLGFKIEGRKKISMILDNGKYVDTFIVGKVLK